MEIGELCLPRMQVYIAEALILMHCYRVWIYLGEKEDCWVSAEDMAPHCPGKYLHWVMGVETATNTRARLFAFVLEFRMKDGGVGVRGLVGKGLRDKLPQEWK